jgi:hypothetical protein
MSLRCLLRRLLGHAENRSVHHTLVVGASRSGKSEAELSRLVPLARAGSCAIVVMDPPGSLARKLLLHLHALGLGHRVLYDMLSATDRVPGYDWLSPSCHPDPLQREAENDERCREFAAILLRRRRIQDPALTPLIEEGVLSALRLYLTQRSPCPLPWVADMFDLGSRHRAHLLANCTDPALVRKFQSYATLSPTARRTETGPAERVLRAVLTSPAFRVRSGQTTFDLGTFLDDRGILLLDGGSRGNLSRDAMSVMLGAIILRVISHCRTGSKSRVVLVLDEAVNAGLIGSHESQAVAEAAKWRLEFHILVQDPFSFASDEIRSNVLQNTWRHEFFRQGSPEAARLAAQDIGTAILDPLKIHHTEHRIRTADAGFERVHTTSKSEWSAGDGQHGRSRSHGTVLWPRRREVTDNQPRFTALTDQILLIQQQLMLLKPGYRFVRGDTVTRAPEYMPMLHEPLPARQLFGGTKDRHDPDALFRAVLDEMKQRPEFRSPLVDADDIPAARSGRGAAKTLAEYGAGDTPGDRAR